MTPVAFSNTERRHIYLLIILLLFGFMLTAYHEPQQITSRMSPVDNVVCGPEVEEAASLEEIISKTSTRPAAADQVLVSRPQLEEIRRQVAGGMRSTLVFLRYHLERMVRKEKSRDKSEELEAFMAEAVDRLRVTQFDLAKLDRSAGLTAWQEEESIALSQVVQQQIHAHQHPDNCTAARKLLCPTDRIIAGLGSVIHFIIPCLMAAHTSGRTAVLYYKRQDRLGAVWENIFLPLGQACFKSSSIVKVPWPGTNDSECVEFPKNEKTVPKTPLKPLGVPRDIASRLHKFNDYPGAWWAGQFAKYVMRLQPDVLKMIDAIKKDLNYSHPIVGVHVRRTDKNSEAPYQPMAKYMKHVEDFYQSLDLASPSGPPTPRKVFLASEEPSVVIEARSKYPTYEITWHNNTAKRVRDRFTTSAFKDIATEIYLLAQADYLVCTFSSNVCRLSFELMQSFRTDASSRVVSLDHVYVFHAMDEPRHIVRFPHHPDRIAQAKNYMKVEAGQEVTSYFKSSSQNGCRTFMIPGKISRTENSSRIISCSRSWMLQTLLIFPNIFHGDKTQKPTLTDLRTP
ncbi:alpha-(1,6)-fucosyltransferase-like isoform X2 [Portunus trituberculatus]|uniref:alpha-(1,6)-fucosyltransferase-like isoform X2 n=1 Tax=Portunus trituberculatus TaxID=210409 RepID=UPI001E1CDDD6|nr:alpha-(1,6)-fucosyltransferase-like isoform X2 [Portunus trituberculatus]